MMITEEKKAQSKGEENYKFPRRKACDLHNKPGRGEKLMSTSNGI